MKLLNIKFVSVMWLLIIVAASCTDNSKSTALLQQAMEIIEENPKHALALLDSIDDPDEMDKDSYMKYVVANVQARYKNYKDVTSDTLIFEAQKYFDTKSDHNQAALAHYYAGVVHYENRETDKELYSYLRAEEHAQHTANDLLIAKNHQNIAGVYKRQNLDSLAIKYYNKALNNYDRIDNTTEYKLQVLRQIGSVYYRENKLKHAELYYAKGLELANIDENVAYKTMFTRHLGVTYREMGYYNKSHEYLREALNTSCTAEDSLSTCLNLAKLYNVTHRLDSAKLYTEFIQKGLTEVKDKKVLRSMYGALADYNLQCGNHQEAKHYNDLWHKTEQQIKDANSAAKLLEVTKQYQLELQKKEQKASEAQMFFGIIILALCIALMVMFGCMKYRKMKARELQKANEIKQLESEKELLNEKLESFAFLQNIILDVIKNWSRIDCQVKELAVEYGATDEPTIYKEISAMIENLQHQTTKELIEWAKEYIRKQIQGNKISKSLRDKDFLLLMLCLLGYPKSDISMILRMTESKIYPRKLNIKRSLREVGFSDDKIEAMLFPHE